MAAGGRPSPLWRDGPGRLTVGHRHEDAGRG